MASVPTRVDKALFDAAKSAGELYSRSAAQQLAHWARLGREMESSTSVTQAAITRVLAGQGPYDDLPDSAQAAVRLEWDNRVAAALDDLDLTGDLEAAGRPWPEADGEGTLVMRDPSPAAAAD